MGWRVLSFLALLCCLNIGSLALEIGSLEFELSADELQVDEDTEDIQASGNVDMSYANYDIRSDRFEYIASKNTLIFIDNVEVLHLDQEIRSDNFIYSIDSNTGFATQLESTYQSARFSGDRIDLTPTQSVLQGVSFSTCDSNGHTDYKFESQSVTLYHESNTLVANENHLFLFDTPILFLPRLIHNLSTTQKDALTPFPELGHNVVDGSYLRLNYPYFLNPQSMGSAVLGFSSRRGYIVGAQHRYLFSPTQALIFTLTQIDKTGFSGGLEYDWEIASFHNAPVIGVLSMLDPNILPTSVIQFRYFEDYLYNNYLIDQKPQVEWINRNIPLWKHLAVDVTLGTGHYRESSNTGTRHKLAFDTSYSIKLKEHWGFRMSLNDIHYLYPDQSKKWNRSYSTFGPVYSKDETYIHLFYTPVWYAKGSSPFFFDSHYELLNTEIGIDIKTAAFGLILGTEINYDLEEDDYRRGVGIIGLDQECWSCQLEFDWVREQVSLVFEIKL